VKWGGGGGCEGGTDLDLLISESFVIDFLTTLSKHRFLSNMSFSEVLNKEV
jgi:hypothetical protein